MDEEKTRTRSSRGRTILNRMTMQKYNDMRLFNEQRKIEYIHNQKGADNIKIHIDVLDGRQTADEVEGSWVDIFLFKERYDYYLILTDSVRTPKYDDMCLIVV